MNKGQITDIFFDLDHTLWDFDRNSKLAFERIFEQRKIPLALSDFMKVYEPINFQYWKQYREERISKQELRRGRFKDAFAPFGISFPIEVLDEISLDYIAELPKDNYLFDGTIELLEYLTQKNYNLHIITNGFDEVQYVKLKKSKIDFYFNTVTTSEDVGVKKPNPKVFKHALSLANVQASASVMIGDTFEADILGAESVGMHTLFFNYRNEKVPDNYRVVDAVSEIKLHF